VLKHSIAVIGHKLRQLFLADVIVLDGQCLDVDSVPRDRVEDLQFGSFHIETEEVDCRRLTDGQKDRIKREALHLNESGIGRHRRRRLVAVAAVVAVDVAKRSQCPRLKFDLLIEFF